MTEETHNKLKEIKQSFRLMMNGVASQSMRDMGVSYKINWGASIMSLRDMAKEYGKDYSLAIELWKEDIRECKILATMIMPAERMDAELLDVWMESVRTQEIAEMLAFNLLQYVDFAPSVAYQWIAMDDEFRQIAGYSVLGRLFMNGQEPNERGINEFLDQCQAALSGGSVGIRHAAYNCAQRFAQLGIVYQRMAKSALKGLAEFD